MSGAEAMAVLSLVSSVITIFESAQEIYEAVNDASGLPKKFRTAADQIPVIHKALTLAEENIKANAVTDDALLKAQPVLKHCKDRATELKDIFHKSIPGKDASRSERLKKAMAIKMHSAKVKDYVKEIIEGMELLAQTQIFQDSLILADIKEAIDQLDSASDSAEQAHFAHSGSGAINALTGSGTQNNHINSGSGKQYNAGKQFFGRDQGTDDS